MAQPRATVAIVATDDKTTPMEPMEMRLPVEGEPRCADVPNGKVMTTNAHAMMTTTTAASFYSIKG